MSGVAVPNLPTYYRDSVVVAAREVEVPNADFDNGANLAGANAPGIGINTGDYAPKLEDWPNSDWNGVNDVPYNGKSQHIGLDPGANDLINAVQGADLNDTLQLVLTVGAVAPDGALAVGVVNRTGKTVPTGTRCWGTVTVA